MTKGWWCCKADYGKHERDCPNFDNLLRMSKPEPDQIDMMGEEELRKELRSVIKLLHEAPKSCQHCGSTELHRICASCLKDDIRETINDSLRK